MRLPRVEYSPPSAKDIVFEVLSVDFVAKPGNFCFTEPVPGLATPFMSRLLEPILSQILKNKLEDRQSGAGDDRGIGVAEIAELLVSGSGTLGGIDLSAPLLNTPCNPNNTNDPTDGDATCQDPGVFFLGTQRHQCATTGACTDIRFEPRRLNVLPQGLEIVLADGAWDPQHEAIANGTAVGLLGILTGSCRPQRFPQEPRR